MLLYIPRKKDLADFMEGFPELRNMGEFVTTKQAYHAAPPYDQYPYCFPEMQLSAAADKHGFEALFAPNHHYSKLGNEAVATALADFIVAQQQD